MKDKIIEALELMDAIDDDQWTADGAPKVDVVSSLSGLDSVKRADIINAAPKFSRENPDVSADDESDDESDEIEENTQGWQHPEIVKAQKKYDEIIAVKAEIAVEEIKLGEKLTEVTNRLMIQRVDKQANQREIMRTIRASSEARAARVEGFNKNRALLMDQKPMSPLDEAKKAEKKVRPLNR